MMEYQSELYKKLDLVPGDFVIGINVNVIIKPASEKMISFRGFKGMSEGHSAEGYFLNNFKPLPFKVGDIVNFTDEFMSVIPSIIPKQDKIVSIEYRRVDGKFLYTREGESGGYFTLNKDGTNRLLPNITVFKLVQSRSGNISLPSIDTSRFPHTCIKCGAPSYNGYNRVECSKCGEY